MTCTRVIERGIFAVYKPRGVFSTAVTDKVKRVILEAFKDQQGGGKKINSSSVKVGHGGVLDWAAEGVMVVALGQDCKKLTSFLSGDKSYEVVGELGKATTTYDLGMDSSVTMVKPYDHIQADDIKKALDSFRGQILQRPPVYSNLKKGGQRLSDLARKGISVEPEPRKVTLYSICLVDYTPPHFRLSLECSGGTYVRSLVNDLGLHLCSAASVTYLCRTKQSPFSVSNALKMDQLTVENIARAVIEQAS